MPTNTTTIRFSSFPQTEPPPAFVVQIIDTIRLCERGIGTELLSKGLKSDDVLEHIRPGLVGLGFEVEDGKSHIIDRPVLFGENGASTLKYEIDAYHKEWRCGLEVEAARATKGNAVYRDLFQALVMNGVDHLVLLVPNSYRFKNNKTGGVDESKDYEYTLTVARTLFGHPRFKSPYGLTLVGY